MMLFAHGFVQTVGTTKRGDRCPCSFFLGFFVIQLFNGIVLSSSDNPPKREGVVEKMLPIKNLREEAELLPKTKAGTRGSTKDKKNDTADSGTKTN